MMDIVDGGTRKPKRSPKRKHDETVVADDTMDEAEMEKKGVFFIQLCTVLISYAYTSIMYCTTIIIHIMLYIYLSPAKS